MSLRLSLPAVVLLGACGANKPIAAPMTATSPVPAPDAFTCIRDQIKAMGWVQTSYDTDELRVNARKYDEKARRPDVQFRRLIHRLSFDVNPGSGGAITSITGTAATYGEYVTQRGPTEIQEPTDKDAQAALQAILDRCSQAKAPS